MRRTVGQHSCVASPVLWLFVFCECIFNEASVHELVTQIAHGAHFVPFRRLLVA